MPKDMIFHHVLCILVTALSLTLSLSVSLCFAPFGLTSLDVAKNGMVGSSGGPVGILDWNRWENLGQPTYLQHERHKLTVFHPRPPLFSKNVTSKGDQPVKAPNIRWQRKATEALVLWSLILKVL